MFINKGIIPSQNIMIEVISSTDMIYLPKLPNGDISERSRRNYLVLKSSLLSDQPDTYNY